MSASTRASLYKKIETKRGRPLIVYITSKREGVVVNMATDALPYIIEQLDQLPKGTKELDFMIVSYGGDPMVAWRIMSLIRQRIGGKGKVSALVPQSAYSAATLLCLGCDEIVMHTNSHLGPVDMQIHTVNEVGRTKRFSTEEISAFLEFVRDNLKITDQEHIRMLFESICKEVGSLAIGFTARSSKLAVDLGERLLAMHTKDDDSRSKLRSLVENMSRKFQSHSYPVNRTEAKELGLKVRAEDEELESLMWDVWLDVEEELKERTPFHPLLEVLASPQSAKLLSSVPQLELPINAASPSYFQATLADVKDVNNTTAIEAVDFDVITAIVESSRKSHFSLERGKILACRAPNLMINYNPVVTKRGWEERIIQSETSTPPAP